jgi:hypothetical protein
MSEDLSDLQHMFKEKIGRAISHCPVLEMTLSICHPELLVTDTVCKPALVPTHCFDLARDGCKYVYNSVQSFLFYIINFFL